MLPHPHYHLDCSRTGHVVLFRKTRLATMCGLGRLQPYEIFDAVLGTSKHCPSSIFRPPIHDPRAWLMCPTSLLRSYSFLPVGTRRVAYDFANAYCSFHVTRHRSPLFTKNFTRHTHKGVWRIQQGAKSCRVSQVGFYRWVAFGGLSFGDTLNLVYIIRRVLTLRYEK